jgi:hypothetical protein
MLQRQPLLEGSLELSTHKQEATDPLGRGLDIPRAPPVAPPLSVAPSETGRGGTHSRLSPSVVWNDLPSSIRDA